LNVRLEFQAPPELDVRSVAVVGSFNGYSQELGAMNREGTLWFCTIPLSQGEHYYKFLINDVIRLNDPLANMYLPHRDEELWSTIIINEEGERLYNNEQYSVHIESYSVSGGLNKEAGPINKKNFSLFMDRMVALRFGFVKIRGLHAVTVLWYDPRGNLYDVSENMLFAEENPNATVFLWFWLPLNEPGKEYPEGTWTMHLYIDGSYVLEDQVWISQTLTYSPGYQTNGNSYGLV